MPKSAIIYSLVVLSVILTSRYLSKATNKEVVRNELGQYLLRMHKLYYIVGIIAFVFGAIFSITPIITKDADIVSYIIMFLVLFLFGGLGLLAVLYFKRHYVLFDDTKIEVGSPFGNIKCILWTEITKAKFYPSSGLLTLTNKTGEKMKLHSHLVGFPRFIEQLESKTTWTAQQLKLPTPNKQFPK